MPMNWHARHCPCRQRSCLSTIGGPAPAHRSVRDVRPHQASGHRLHEGGAGCKFSYGFISPHARRATVQHSDGGAMRETIRRLRATLPPLLKIQQYCRVMNRCTASAYSDLRAKPGLAVKVGGSTRVLRDRMLDEIARLPAW